jgi:hypothetical protein
MHPIPPGKMYLYTSRVTNPHMRSKSSSLPSQAAYAAYTCTTNKGSEVNRMQNFACVCTYVRTHAATRK